MAFMVRKIEINGSSLGAKIKALRKDRGWNVEQAASLIHVHPRLIKALEANNFAALPEPIYTRNFLRHYIRSLGGDETYFLDCFEQARGTCDLIDPLLLPRQKVRRARFLVTPRIFKFLGVGLIACLVLGYLGFEVRRILIPPTVQIITPSDGFTTEEPIVTVTGQVFEQSTVVVNGEAILINKDGSFSAEVDLERGLNLITVAARKRYSQTTTVHRRVVLQGAPQGLTAVYPPRSPSLPESL